MLSRRSLGSSLPLLAAAPVQGAERPKRGFRFCLNTSTIRGQQLPLPKSIEVASRAGYDAIEPWIREIDDFVKSGGTVGELRRRIEDAGLTLESAIGFPEWIVDDPARRQRGLDEARRAMDLLRELGGRRIAAPPAGATDRGDLHPLVIAERYRTLVELGEQSGINPQLELWGFSKCLSRVGEVAFATIETAHPKAILLPDIYHIRKGGSSLDSLKYLTPTAFEVLHMNDVPDTIPRERLRDADRIYPGDGSLPLVPVLRDLHQRGFHLVLSLELFNPEYWKQDALLVARTGLTKLKSLVKAATRD